MEINSFIIVHWQLNLDNNPKAKNLCEIGTRVQGSVKIMYVSHYICYGICEIHVVHYGGKCHRNTTGIHGCICRISHSKAIFDEFHGVEQGRAGSSNRPWQKY